MSKLIRLHTCPKNKPDLGRPPHRNFVHQKNSDHLKNNLKNNIERVPIDSAHFYLHRGLDLEPVPIATLDSGNRRSGPPSGSVLLFQFKVELSFVNEISVTVFEILKIELPTGLFLKTIRANREFC